MMKTGGMKIVTDMVERGIDFKPTVKQLFESLQQLGTASPDVLASGGRIDFIVSQWPEEWGDWKTWREPNTGKTWTHLALDEQTGICMGLLEKGLDPNIQDKKGNTALHLSFDMDARVLLLHGAKPNIVNNEGKTPLDCALDRMEQRMPRTNSKPPRCFPALFPTSSTFSNVIKSVPRMTLLPQVKPCCALHKRTLLTSPFFTLGCPRPLSTGLGDHGERGAGYFGPTPFGETAQTFGNDRPQEKRRTATA